MYPIVILDWDYDTFDIGDDNGDILFIYDAPQDSELLLVEGWIWVGKYLPQTLYKRDGDPFRFVRQS